MSLRIPPPPALDGASPAEGAPEENSPLATPFAAGPGGFVLSDEMEPKASRFSWHAVLLGVLVVGAALLLGMRKLGMGPKLDLLAVQIDYPLDAQGAPVTQDHSRVLEDLRTGGTVERVPLENVQTNPFAWRSLIQDTKPKAAEVDPAELTRRERENRRRMIAEEAGKLTLNGVMAGRVPIARISGQTVRVGDMVGEFFRVKSITGREVQLESEGEVFVLGLSVPEPGSAGGPNGQGGSRRPAQ
ncbi:MAG: hypothetical protein SFZ24_07360 [Planctomycetota bacterium]|nr:hypothetical protein [Planctomycetota bacterium]